MTVSVLLSLSRNVWLVLLGHGWMKRLPRVSLLVQNGNVTLDKVRMRSLNDPLISVREKLQWMVFWALGFPQFRPGKPQPHPPELLETPPMIHRKHISIWWNSNENIFIPVPSRQTRVSKIKSVDKRYSRLSQWHWTNVHRDVNRSSKSFTRMKRWF